MTRIIHDLLCSDHEIMTLLPTHLYPISDQKKLEFLWRLMNNDCQDGRNNFWSCLFLEIINFFLSPNLCAVVINYNPGCKVGYLAILNTARSACRAAEQSQVGYQGPGEPENIQRVEREEQSERIISVSWKWRFKKTLLPSTF